MFSYPTSKEVNCFKFTQVEKVYQQLYGRLLIDDLKGDLSGYFEKLSLALFMSNIEQDVVNLKEAVDVINALSINWVI